MSAKHFNLIFCLLTGILLAGCGSEETSDTSGQQPAAPTLAGSFEGKRIHFQILPGEEGGRTEEFWLQMGEGNQLTVNDGGRNMTMPYVISDTRLIVNAGGEAIEIRFNKVELTAGDQVTFFEHNNEDGNLQALLASTDDSAAKRTSPGSIVKLEAAQEIVAESAPEPDTPPASVETEATPQENPNDPLEDLKP